MTSVPKTTRATASLMSISIGLICLAKPSATLHQQIPRPTDMSFGRLEVTDRDAQRQALAQARVRQEHVTVVVDLIDEPLVGGVQLSGGQVSCGRVPPEADDAE